MLRAYIRVILTTVIFKSNCYIQEGHSHSTHTRLIEKIA